MDIKKAVFLIVMLFSILSADCSKEPQQTGKIRAAVSILPLADFVREVGGDNVEVEVLIQPGHSPHTYEPPASQLKFLSSAQLLVLNGVGLEFWAENIIDAAGNPHLRVVNTSEGIDIIDEHHHDAEHGHEEEMGNPHVWLDPVNAQHQVEMIAEALAEADEKNSPVYHRNANLYIQKLKTLDAEIQSRVAKFSSRKFISYHGGFAYFVRRYGLEEAAVIERSPGRQPSPTDVQEIIKIAKKVKARAIFAEPQFPAQTAEVIASECGAQVIFLNPLGQPPDYKYITTMKYNIAQLELALK